MTQPTRKLLGKTVKKRGFVPLNEDDIGGSFGLPVAVCVAELGNLIGADSSEGNKNAYGWGDTGDASCWDYFTQGAPILSASSLSQFAAQWSAEHDGSVITPQSYNILMAGFPITDLFTLGPVISPGTPCQQYPCGTFIAKCDYEIVTPDHTASGAFSMTLSFALKQVNADTGAVTNYATVAQVVVDLDGNTYTGSLRKEFDYTFFNDQFLGGSAKRFLSPQLTASGSVGFLNPGPQTPVTGSATDIRMIPN